jgi:hypothetical protein
MDPTFHFEHEGLIIDLEDAGDRATLRWKGVSDTRDPTAHLAPFFQKLLARLSGRAVTIDFRELEYMNSAVVSPSSTS